MLLVKEEIADFTLTGKAPGGPGPAGSNTTEGEERECVSTLFPKATFPKARGRFVTGTTDWMLVSHIYKFFLPETQKKASENGELPCDV